MNNSENNRSIRETGIKDLAARVERLERAQFESLRRDVLAGVEQSDRGEVVPWDRSKLEARLVDEMNRQKGRGNA